jgi:hypothetical protein
MGLTGRIMGGPPGRGCHPIGGGGPRPPKLGGGPPAAHGGRMAPPGDWPLNGGTGPGTNPRLRSICCRFGAGPGSEPSPAGPSWSRRERVPACEGSMEGYMGPPPLPAPGGRLKKLGPEGAPNGTAPPICMATCSSSHYLFQSAAFHHC